MKLQFPEENNHNFENNFSSSKKEINKKMQNEYLIKYKNLFGDSFNDVELIDIFEKKNYNENEILNDIKALLSIGNDKKYYNDNTSEEHHSPSFVRNINSKTNIINKKYDKNKKDILSNDSEIPSDYPPPPKDDENINNIINNNKDTLLQYKKILFKKLKSGNNTYKINNYKDEINFDDNSKLKTEFNTNKYKDHKEIKLIELYKNNNNIKNCSPNSKYQSIQINNYNKDNSNNNISNEEKKKYIQYFFGNMKNYSKKSQNNLKGENFGKSPDFNRRRNINISPDKPEFYEQKVLTYKKGIKNYYSNKKRSYNYLKVNFKVNDIFIPACYDNPNREQFLKIINEKKQQNPDKIIEFLYPQIPPMGPIPYYSNIYQPYNQFNPYMNMYMTPPPIQYPLQNSLNNEIINSNQFQNSNNIQNIQNFNNNNLATSGNNCPELANSLNNNELVQLNNNQVNNQTNTNSNPNSLLMNKIGMHNYSSNNKSSGNVSTSGIINTTSSFK